MSSATLPRSAERRMLCYVCGDWRMQSRRTHAGNCTSECEVDLIRDADDCDCELAIEKSI